MIEIFKCIYCGDIIEGWPPNTCKNCGTKIKSENDILIFSKEPNLKIENTEQSYIGYDTISSNYDSRYSNEEYSKEGKLIADIIGKENILLDIGAGTGHHDLPIADNENKVIAGDISLNMLDIFKAKLNNLQKQFILLCRFNAYQIPIKKDSIDVITANLLLHLIGNPQSVINEIKRVMKPEGIFITIDKEDLTDKKQKKKNKRFDEVFKNLISYRRDLINESNLTKIKSLGWRSFNEKSQCLDDNFSKTEVVDSEELFHKTTFRIKDSISKMRNLTYSNQVKFNKEIHDKIMDKVDEKLTKDFGENYANITAEYASRSRIRLYSKPK